MWKGKTALGLLISAHKRITGSINRLYRLREPQRLLRQPRALFDLRSSNESPALLTGSDASRSGCCGKESRV
jgi:hypothetical protein